MGPTQVYRMELEADPTIGRVQLEETALQSLRPQTGGNVKVAVVSGDFVSSTLESFLRRLFAGANILAAYGTGEVGGIGANGEVFHSLPIRVEDVPELGFTSEDRPHPR